MIAQRRSKAGALQQGRQILGLLAQKAWAFLRAAWPHSKGIATKEGIISIVLLAIVFMLVNEVGRNVVVIDAFSVPTRFEEDGYGSTMIANQMADKIADLREKAGRYARGHPQFALSSEMTLPDVQVAEAKVSLNGIVEYLRRMLGKEHATVDGEISFLPTNTASHATWTDPASQMLITVRVRKGSKMRRYKHFQVAAGNLEAGIQQAAREILVALDPLVVAVSDHASGDNAAAAELARQCSHDQNRIYAAKCFVIRGALQVEQGTAADYEQAISMFGEALRLDKTLPQAMIDQGVAYERLNQFPAALAMLTKAERAIKDDSDMLAAVYVNRGIVFTKQNELAKAISSYEEATRVDPLHALAYNNWCDALITQGRLTEARPICQHSIDADPQFAMGYATFGELLSKQDQMPDADGMFHRATDIDPRLIGAWLAWGDALTSHGQSQKAQAIYKDGIQKNPNEPRLLTRITQMHLRPGVPE